MLSDGTAVPELVFQWGHFFSEMDSSQLSAKGMIKTSGLNWATSFQKWIELNFGTKEQSFPSFNGATSFQKWIGQPFLGLCCYRNNSVIRRST
jgi:hypothetical protein